MIKIARQQNIMLGILYATIAAFALAVMSAFVKKVGTALPTSIVIFFRFATSLILLLPWILADRTFSFKVPEPFRYCIRIFSALLALFLLFYAIKFIPLVDALLLNNTAPLFVPIIAWFLLGAKTPTKALIGIAIGFIGIGLILRPDNAIFKISALIALVSGFFAGLAMVQIRLISKTSTIKQMLFYYFSVSTIASGIMAAIQWHTPETTKIWWLLLEIGLAGTCYQIFATLAYATAPVRIMAPFFFLTVVFGTMFDWLIWQHVPTGLTILGASLVIIGSIITVYFSQQVIRKN